MFFKFMNKLQTDYLDNFFDVFDIGDLIILGDELALIVDKTRLPLIPEAMYRLHFCENDYLDERWVFADDCTFFRG